MDQMIKMRADGGPLALRLKSQELRIEQLEEQIKSLETRFGCLEPMGEKP